MSAIYTWDGVAAAWVLHPDVPSVSGATMVAETSKATVTTLTAPASAAPGASITLSATVKAGSTSVPSGTVTFERLSTDGTAWVNVGSDDSPPWSVSPNAPSTAGTWKYRARFEGSGIYIKSTSATKSMTVSVASVRTTWSGYATSSRSYNGDGSLRYEYELERCYHGYYSSTNADQRAALWFSIPSNVGGSTVHSVTLRLSRIASLGDSSASVKLGYHRDASVSSTWSGIDPKFTGTQTVAAPTYSSSVKTTTYSLVDTFENALESGGVKGIVIGPSGGTSNYCAFYGEEGVSTSYKPRLEIDYTYTP